MAIFLDPYQAQKLLEGVIPANQPVRPNWLQSFFGDVGTTERNTVNFDREHAIKNTMGMYVSPNADATPIQLPGFGHAEMGFAYAKESLTSPDYEEISGRQLGQQFGQVNIMENEVNDIRQKLAIAEQRFENLFELNAANLLTTAKHTAESEKHPKVYYDFGRTVVTTDAGYLAGYVPEIDLTTLNGNGGVGKRAWGSTGGTASPTPVKDLIKIVKTASRKGNFSGNILMSEDAYEQFELDLNTNYKDAADLTISAELRFNRVILPVLDKYADLNFKRSYPCGGGVTVDIYCYTATYNHRTTGTETKYIPDGYVVALPKPQSCIKRYGRIMHPRAQYAAMPRWINFWEDTKTGKREWETHVNFVMGFKDPDSVVSWKVK